MNQKKNDFDLLVIGAGSAGFAASIRASDLDASVGLIEGHIVGGTCVNRGCVPSKTLIRAAAAYHQISHHPFEGIPLNHTGVSWSEIKKQKDDLVSSLRNAKYIDVLKSYPSVLYIEGAAKILSTGEVLINGTKKLKADKIIIATGASPAPSPIPKLEELRYLTSTTVMELETLPQSLVVIGASAVGLELGQMFSRLGKKVTVVEVAPRIVPLEAPEISDGLQTYLEQEGMSVFTHAKVTDVNMQQGNYTFNIEHQGKPKELIAEQVLLATGRSPNSKYMGLEEAGIKLGPKGHIETNAFLQTSIPHIYAAGDCTNKEMFVYVSAYSGALAAENALRGNTLTYDVSVLPKVTFTDPQIASIGLTQQQAKEKGIQAESRTLPLAEVPRALAARETKGFIQIVAEKNSGTLLGAHILAPEGGEQIELIAMAMKTGLTITDLGKMLFPYLTQSESIKLCAQMFTKDIKKLSCCAA